MSRVRFPDPASCWFSSLLREVFSGTPVFPSLRKPALLNSRSGSGLLSSTLSSASGIAQTFPVFDIKFAFTFFYIRLPLLRPSVLKEYSFGKKSLLRFMFLQETSLFVKATQQTSAAKPQVFPSQHCPGNLKMGTSHQVSIKAVLVKDHFWSCLALQNKWKVSTSVQQKTKLMQQLLLHIFMFLVRI